MAGAKLTDEGKTFVVQALACFDAPSVVAAAVRKEFSVTLTPQAVEGYDPGKRAGRNLAPKWQALFAETRARFLEDQAGIGVAHRVVRLRRLDRMADRAEGMGNIALAASLLEQAAKEVGGALTNRREVTGAGGKPIQAEVSAKPDLSALDQKGRDALRTVVASLAGGSEGDAEGA